MYVNEMAASQVTSLAGPNPDRAEAKAFSKFSMFGNTNSYTIKLVILLIFK